MQEMKWDGVEPSTFRFSISLFRIRSTSYFLVLKRIVATMPGLMEFLVRT